MIAASLFSGIGAPGGRMEITPLTLAAADDFIERWHRHSTRTNNDGGMRALGLKEPVVIPGQRSGTQRDKSRHDNDKSRHSLCRMSDRIYSDDQWDRPGRPREKHAIYEQPKFRWEL